MQVPETQPTPLQEVIAAFALKVTEIVRVANRLARELGVVSISRNHLFDLRSGRKVASEERIFILVAALREMTGVMFRAGDLFRLEPAGAGASTAGGDARVSWRAVADEPAPASDRDFETLYVEYGVLLRTIAMRGFGVPPDDAEALVHDCFVAYLERRGTVENPKAWLAGAMRNSCRHYLRERKREAPLGPEHDAAVDPAPQASVEVWMRKLTLAAVVARLGEKCRETLRGFLADEGRESLAGRLSTSPGYIDQLISICRRRLQQMFRSSSRRTK